MRRLAAAQGGPVNPDLLPASFGNESEARRLQELLSRELLDTRPEQRLDQFTRLVADVMEAPMAYIAVMDEQTQSLKSRVGLEFERIRRDEAFCNHTLMSGALEIPDTHADPRFREHRLVLGEPGIRFYAGVTLLGPDDAPVGTLCVLDVRPRALGDAGWRRLRAFAHLVEQELRFNVRVAEAREAIEHTALRDPVTGLPRRSILVELLERALAGAKERGERVAVGQIRFPRYDEVLAVYGRERVEYLAELFSERLRCALRSGDYLGRLEADTFCVVATQVAAADEAVQRMRQLCDALRQPYNIGGGTREVMVGFGVSMFPEDASEAVALMDRAGLAAGRAETAGEQAPIFFSSDVNTAISRRDQVAQRLSRALERDRMELHYQPVLDARTGMLVGCEALARWTCPQLGRVSPGEFIPVAERDPRLSRTLTHYVLEHACQQAAAWRASVQEPFWISVNVAGGELHDPDLAGAVQELITRYQLPAGTLVVELTEQSMITDLDGAVAVMERLQSLGVHCAVDDFGTGYSSLNYLRRLPVDKLKIDRSFIDAMREAGPGRDVVRAIVGIGHALGMSVVAEGVETHDQVQLLCDLDCDELQGFLVRHAVPAADIEAMMQGGARIPWVWEEETGKPPRS